MLIVFVDITGFTMDEVEKMKDLRSIIQREFIELFALSCFEDTVVNFTVDPSIESSLTNRCVASIHTEMLTNGTNEGRAAVCKIVEGLMEDYGGHTFNEAFAH